MRKLLKVLEGIKNFSFFFLIIKMKMSEKDDQKLKYGKCYSNIRKIAL